MSELGPLSKNYFIEKPKRGTPYCPECKSGYIRFRSRRKYFIKAGIYTAVFLFCCWFIKSLIELQDDPQADALVSIGSLIFIPLGLIMGILLIINIIKGSLKKIANYKCVYCKDVFIVPFRVMDHNDSKT